MKAPKLRLFAVEAELLVARRGTNYVLAESREGAAKAIRRASALNELDLDDRDDETSRVRIIKTVALNTLNEIPEDDRMTRAFSSPVAARLGYEDCELKGVLAELLFDRSISDRSRELLSCADLAIDRRPGAYAGLDVFDTLFWGMAAFDLDEIGSLSPDVLTHIRRYMDEMPSETELPNPSLTRELQNAVREAQRFLTRYAKLHPDGGAFALSKGTA